MNLADLPKIPKPATSRAFFSDWCNMSKAARKRAVSEMLARYKRGATVVGDDDTFLRDLIQNHPDYHRGKFGAGVARFFVDLAKPYKRMCFWFVTTDGKVDNFGTTWCIDGEPPLRRRLIMACRAATQADMHAVKAAHFGDLRKAICQISGEVMSWDEASVDHVVPFDTLVNEWLDARPFLGLDALAPDTPGSVGDRFADPDLAEEFRWWHASVAQLRVVRHTINMSMGNRR